MPERGLYQRNFDDAQRERALLSAVGFTGAFAAARGITHAIKAGVGPFRNMSAGGRHLHHSTFGIFGLLGIGFLWTQQVFTGHDEPPRWGSRVTATTYGIAAALTLDEFALWLDLHDDYWDKQGRKSIDAVAIFGGLLGIVLASSEALDEFGLMPDVLKRLASLDIGSHKDTAHDDASRRDDYRDDGSQDDAPHDVGTHGDGSAPAG
jgi:hypothetical protein